MRTDRRSDGQADMKKLIVAFHNFAKEPKNSLQIGFVWLREWLSCKLLSIFEFHKVQKFLSICLRDCHSIDNLFSSFTTFNKI